MRDEENVFECLYKPVKGPGGYNCYPKVYSPASLDFNKVPE
jgi:hypothetical protein